MIIDIHGLVIRCHSGSSRLLNSISRPFKYFVKNGLPKADINPTVDIYIKKTEPPYDSFPKIDASFSTPRNVIFSGRNLKIIDYFGNGAVVEDMKSNTFTIYGKDNNFLQESFYLLVMSLFGQHCDRKGMLRIHALTFSYNDSAVIFSAPSGGGKSTMALSILEKECFKLISDDEAVITASGHVLTLPIRIGTLDRNKISSIPKKYVYEIDRMEFGTKYFVDIDFWNDKLENRVLQKKIFFSARRLMNGEARIEKVSGLRTFNHLFGNAVIGFGLYQGMEFIFNNSPWEIIKRLPVLINRLICAVKFSFITKGYQMYLSRDSSQNMRVLEEFLFNLPE